LSRPATQATHAALLTILPGQPALPGFRLEKALQTARNIDAGVTGVSAAFVYFVDLARELGDAER